MEKRGDKEGGKKGLWAILKESMNKASSGCGPGCGCHVENKKKDSPEQPGRHGEQT